MADFDPVDVDVDDQDDQEDETELEWDNSVLEDPEQRQENDEFVESFTELNRNTLEKNIKAFYKSIGYKPQSFPVEDAEFAEDKKGRKQIFIKIFDRENRYIQLTYGPKMSFYTLSTLIKNNGKAEVMKTLRIDKDWLNNFLNPPKLDSKAKTTLDSINPETIPLEELSKAADEVSSVIKGIEPVEGQGEPGNGKGKENPWKGKGKENPWKGKGKGNPRKGKGKENSAKENDEV